MFQSSSVNLDLELIKICYIVYIVYDIYLGYRYDFNGLIFDVNFWTKIWPKIFGWLDKKSSFTIICRY